MKLLIIGSTGFVGRSVLNEALFRGHQVTALVRDSSKLKPQDNLTIIEGDVLNLEKTSEQFKGFDAVLSAYNAGWTNPDLYNEYLKASNNIISAVKAAKVPHFLMVGGAGSLFVAPNLQLVDTPDFPNEYLQGALAARKVLTTLEADSEFTWSFISPSILLAPGERTGEFRTGKHELLMANNAPASISVEDLALALVSEAESPNYINQRFTIGY